MYTRIILELKISLYAEANRGQKFCRKQLEGYHFIHTPQSTTSLVTGQLATEVLPCSL